MQPPRGGAPPAGAAPLPVSITYRPKRGGGGTDAGWLFGWLAVAVVVGILILTIVWSGVTAFERFGQQRTAEQTAARKSDAVAAAELAFSKIKDGKPQDAEEQAQRALDLRPDYAPALYALGRSFALQERTDEAIAAFDRATAAAADALRSAATSQERDEARRVATEVPMWRADALYQDGMHALGTDRPRARMRFEEVVRTAPGSTYERGAQEQLRRLAADTAPAPAVPGAAPDGSAPVTPGSAPSATLPTDTNPAIPPANWDNSYRQQGHGPY